MSAYNLHRIAGARFAHEKPNLCPTCRWRRDYGEWQGYCQMKDRILSAPNRARGRCADYDSQALEGNDG